MFYNLFYLRLNKKKCTIQYAVSIGLRDSDPRDRKNVHLRRSVGAHEIF